jgi:hypothetical protein
MRRIWRSTEPRIPDPKRYEEWLSRVSGQAAPQLETVHNTLRVKEAETEAPAKPKPEPVKAAEPAPEPPSPPPVVVPEAGWVLKAVPESTAGPAPSLQGQTVVILCQDPESAKPFIGALKNAGAEEPLVLKGSWRSREEASKCLRAALGEKRAGGLLDLGSLDLEDYDSLTPSGLEKAWRSCADSLRWAAELLRRESDPLWLLVVTRSGGLHGLGRMTSSPIASALSGLARGLGGRAVDFDPSVPLDEMARAAVSQLTAPGSTTCGFVSGRRHGLGFAKQTFPPEPKRSLSNRSTVLLAGVRSPVLSAAGRMLAKRLKCSVLAFGSAELRKEAASWARMSPEELAELEKTRPDAREAMCRSGSKVVYVQADLSEASSAAKAVRTTLRSVHTIDLVVIEPGAWRAAAHLLRSIPPARRQAWVLLSEKDGDPAARGFLSGLAHRLTGMGRAVFSLTLGPDAPEGAADKLLAQAQWNAGDAEVLLFEPAADPASAPQREMAAA